MGVDVGLIPSLVEALHFPQTQTLNHATPMTFISPRKTYHTNFVGKPIKNNKTLAFSGLPPHSILFINLAYTITQYIKYVFYIFS